MVKEIGWEKIISNYDSPTITKEDLLLPYFSELKYSRPILDIGCGGGLLSEPMARLGATVVGGDAAEKNIPVAQIHAQQSGLEIDYRHTSAEEILKNSEKFDVVLNMEVVEHVSDPLAFLTACRQLLKLNGLMLCSTINRNPKST